jgi:hypothetical protein
VCLQKTRAIFFFEKCRKFFCVWHGIIILLRYIQVLHTMKRKAAVFDADRVLTSDSCSVCEGPCEGHEESKRCEGVDNVLRKSLCKHNRRPDGCEICTPEAFCWIKKHHTQKQTKAYVRKDGCTVCSPDNFCLHQKRPADCPVCSPEKFCTHDGKVRRKRNCKTCTPSSVCTHGKAPSRCRDCLGSAFCKHERWRSICPEAGCGGSALCEHQRQKVNCIDCNGVGICKHNLQKASCLSCSACVHNLLPRNCKACGGQRVCIHDKLRQNCRTCEPVDKIAQTGYGELCDHGYLSACIQCGGRQLLGHELCSHGNAKAYCTNNRACGQSIAHRSKEEIRALAVVYFFYKKNVDVEAYIKALKRKYVGEICINADMILDIENQHIYCEYDGLYFHENKTVEDEQKTTILCQSGHVLRIRDRLPYITDITGNCTCITVDANVVPKKTMQYIYKDLSGDALVDDTLHRIRSMADQAILHFFDPTQTKMDNYT